METIFHDVSNTLASEVDLYLRQQLGAKEGEINAREDLTRFKFKCPICQQEKSALEAILVVRNKFVDTVEKNKMTVTLQIALICNACLSGGEIHG